MNYLYNSKLYMNDVYSALHSTICFNKLNKKSVLITGATGLIGSFIVDVLLQANEEYEAGITVYALGRNKKRLEERFDGVKSKNFHIIQHDVKDIIDFNFSVDYIIHAASNAYPAAFNKDPVGTIMSNVLGTYQLLEYGHRKQISRLLYISSGEIYGEGDVNLNFFDETYSGYVDSTKVRSCYPNSKRNTETLCVAYTKQKKLDTVIVRPCHIYGPNITKFDNRASVQFINNVLHNENIVMKSSGIQLRSYCYISDCVSALLTVLVNGKSCEAYNIANSNAKVTIAEYAQIIAELSGNKVVFADPDTLAIAEQTSILKQVLSVNKLESLGWYGKYSVRKGLEHTLKILQNK